MQPTMFRAPRCCFTALRALIKEVARVAGLPFIHVDATSLSETGCRGRDAEDIVKDLIRFNEEHPLLSYGVVFLDEVDKLVARGSVDRAAYSRATQHSLLRIIDGMKVRKGDKIIQTEELRFLFGGAFGNMNSRENVKNPIGFHAESEQKEPQTSAANDFVFYGMESEFMGRITQRVALQTLTRSDMKRILLHSEQSVLRQYQIFLRSAVLN